VFDVMVLGGRDVMGEPLATRRELLTREVPPWLANRTLRSGSVHPIQ
jgi:ATP-dependent DNA ligase